jgi:hypothetical protein
VTTEIVHPEGDATPARENADDAVPHGGSACPVMPRGGLSTRELSQNPEIRPGRTSGWEEIMARITGTSGNDILFGTLHADVIDAGARRDYVYAGGGNDLIIGGLGNDILNGGSGFDRFFFGHQHGADVVQDFGPSDTIDLGEGIDHYFVTEVWSGVRIATVDWQDTADPVQGSIVLSGVSMAEWVTWGGAFGSPGGYSVSALDSGTLIV